MDKTLLKKTIAREWLILLGAIGVGLLMFMSLYYISYYVRDYKEYKKQLAQWHEDHPNPAKEYEKKLSEWEKDKANIKIPHNDVDDAFENLDPKYKEYRKKLSEMLSEWKKDKANLKIPDELKWLIPKFVPDHPTPPKYPPIEFSDYRIWLIVISPYIIIQFIRSIVLAIKQLKY
jgi:hypothetical protein